MQLAAFSSNIKLTLRQIPNEIKIIPWGESFYDEGKSKLVVNAVSLSAIPASQKKYNYDRVALDFNHNSVPRKDKNGNDIPLEEPLKVAAFGNVEVRENDGVWLTNLEWTPEGKSAYEGGHYCDISPTVLFDKNGNVTFVHSAALCRQGRVPGLVLFGADFLAANETSTKDTNMDNDKLKKLLCLVLGLAEDADIGEIEVAANKFAQDQTKAKENQTDDIDEKLEKFSSVLQSIESRLASLENAGTDSAKKAIRDAAIAEGKLIPHSALSLPLEELTKFCSDMPAGQVPVSQRTPEGLKNFSAQTPTNSAEQSVCDQLGITTETLNKHNS